MSQAAEIGDSIRRRRRRAGLTLDGLASRSGVSTTMLSEVERGVKNPTVKLAYQIARALGCTLTDLIEENPAAPARITRADERRALVDPETGVRRSALSPAVTGPDLELAWYELPPGEHSGEMSANRPGLVEHVTVLRGELTMRLGDESHRLGPRDSISYGPQTTMEYRNEGTEPCEFLMVAQSGDRHAQR